MFPDPILHPHLTKDGQGYVYWKGQHVEHFSFRGENADRDELAAYWHLIDKCEKLEMLDVPVNWTAVWYSSWFDGIGDKNHPYLPLLRVTPSMWVRPTAQHDATFLPNGYYNIGEDGHELLFIHRGFFHVWYANKQTLETFAPPDTESIDRHGLYHVLTAQGWRIPNVGQDVRNGNGTVYGKTDGVVAFLERMKIPHGFTLPEPEQE